MIRTVFLAAALLALGTARAISGEVAPSVLFVGNSYTNFNGGVDFHVRHMLAEAGIVPLPRVEARTINNSRLSHHRIGDYIEASAPVGLLVLQGHSTAALSAANASEFRKAVARAASLAEETGAEVALYRTPAYAPQHRHYEEGISARIEALYTAAAAEIGARVIPVGQAFDRALEGRPDILLHKDLDYSHPSPAGTYLAAATVFAAFTGRSPETLSYTINGALGAEEAAYLRQVAAETVLGADLAATPLIGAAPRGG